MGLKTGFETNGEKDRLLRLALNGDREALDRLFASYMPPLYQAALRVLRSPQDAEDALQDGLLAAVRHLKDFEGRSQFSTWLTSIVINAALMRLRKARGQAVASIDEEPLDRDQRPIAAKIADPTPNPEEMYAREERLQILKRKLQSLPRAYRRALWLRDVQGMSTRAAAEALGLPVGSLKSHLHRGRMRIIKHVREALVPRGPFGHTAVLAREVVEPAA